MNGNKGEDRGGHGLCCSGGLRPVYLGIILFVVGLMLQSQRSLPEMLMIIGSLTVVTSLISLFFHKR
ncbi:MAG: hypothetical protein Q8N37_03070 [bacterium]|nr:hypothetical protein [bacterium]